MVLERASRAFDRTMDFLASPGKLKIEAPIAPQEQETAEFKQILDNIREKNINCYFISPHLDDAVLSAGGLIGNLSTRVETKVITVMTQYDKGQSNSLNWMKHCGYEDPEKYMAERRKEDIVSINSLGAQAVHLGFPDMTKETEPSLKDKLREKLAQTITDEAKDKPFIVFAPTSIGRQHKDHRLVNQVVRDTFTYPVIWKEFSLGNIPIEKPLKQLPNPGMSIYRDMADAKINAILRYKTQTPGLFPNRRVRLPEERFYFSRDIIPVLTGDQTSFSNLTLVRTQTNISNQQPS